RARRARAGVDRSALSAAHSEVDGSARGARQDQRRAARPRAGENGAAAEEERVMAAKSEKTGVVISNKMQKSIVVAVEWQVRHGLYGKTERRTSTFMVHDEKNEAKPGDTVAIVETRPMSRRKRWALTRVLRQAAEG